MATSKTQPSGPRYGVYIGGPSPQSVQAAGGVVMQVLSAPHADEETKRAALATLASAFQTGGNTVSNLSISNL